MKNGIILLFDTSIRKVKATSSYDYYYIVCVVFIINFIIFYFLFLYYFITTIITTTTTAAGDEKMNQPKKIFLSLHIYCRCTRRLSTGIDSTRKRKQRRPNNTVSETEQKLNKIWATSMSLTFAPWEPVVPDESTVTVKEVRAYVIGDKKLEEKSGGGADCHAQSHGHWIVDTPISNPMSIYSMYKGSRKSWGIDAIGTVVCEVELTNGMTGVGISIGGEPACFIIENHLSRFVEGQDPKNIELIWDQMWRSTINYGRKGLPIQAISAVDLALWDVLGKLKNEPVYNLLGGKTKGRLPVYATTARPDLAKKMGFKGAKFPLPYGPGDGDVGMRKNIERVKEVRESVGQDFP